jgi:hypothetical protein
MNPHVFDVEAYLSALEAKAQANPRITLEKATPDVCSAFHLRDVELIDAQEVRIPRHTQVRNALPKLRAGGYVQPMIPVNTATLERYQNPTFTAPSDESLHSGGPFLEERPAVARGAEARPSAGPPEPPISLERFVREFDQRERINGAMWAKYVVNSLLPELGCPASEAKLFLRRIEAEGILFTTQVPSRDHPERPATRFHLYREHPSVRAILQRETGGPAARRIIRPMIKLPPGSEPLSEQIIRERR